MTGTAFDSIPTDTNKYVYQMASPAPMSLEPHGHIPKPPLTFSTSLFRHISPTLFLQRHLLQNPPTRPNGRQPHQYRDFTLTTNSLSHAHGSAVVRTGDTAVVCGVRGEILELAPGDDPSRFETYHHSSTSAVHSYGSRGSGGASWGELITINVELSTGCSKKYPLGPPGTLAQALSDQLRELAVVSKLVNLSSLGIYNPEERHDPTVKPRGYWCLYIDVLCISLDGNLLDAAWYAIVAALVSAKLPKASWSQAEERIFCDGSSHHPILLRRSLPFVTTFAVVPICESTGMDAIRCSGNISTCIVLNDPDSYEEEEAIETLAVLSTVVCEDSDVDQINAPSMRTRVEKIEKTGGWNLEESQIIHCTHLAAAKTRDYDRVLLREGLDAVQI
ncbi:hypothetical protein TWF694_002204 [Orbilia ellipsospora]|uniref:Ribosomal RNA-processing protein 43 n=1 Tax=Orbilia ellipsospora TaxID=2528407 RepID=A0AAV9X1D1_9PEZI